MNKFKVNLELDFTKEMKKTSYKKETLAKAIEITIKRVKSRMERKYKKEILKNLLDY
jgi:hypothetical protein